MNAICFSRFMLCFVAASIVLALPESKASDLYSSGKRESLDTGTIAEEAGSPLAAPKSKQHKDDPNAPVPLDTKSLMLKNPDSKGPSVMDNVTISAEQSCETKEGTTIRQGEAGFESCTAQNRLGCRSPGGEFHEPSSTGYASCVKQRDAQRHEMNCAAHGDPDSCRKDGGSVKFKLGG